MNVNDAEVPEVKGCRLQMIFDRQKELMEKYQEIEKKSGVGKALLPETHHLDDRRFQAVCKDFAWRVTEEIVESFDGSTEGETHVWEEAADALHFLVELLLLNNIDVPEVREWSGLKNEDLLEGLFFMEPDEGVINESFILICELGRAMNCLKNKPWKQSQMETDGKRFKGHLLEALVAWMRFARSIGMQVPEDVFNLYFKKAEVNKFRQRSKY